MNQKRECALVLAVYPTSKEFGFVLFESPLSPYDWGIKKVDQNNKNADTLKAARRLIEKYRPEFLVIEDTEDAHSRRSERVKKLCRELTHLASTESVEVRAYPKHVVERCFERAGGTTKPEIAAAIAREIPAFIGLLPNKRKPWSSQDPREALFDAAALAMTHYAVQV